MQPVTPVAPPPARGPVLTPVKPIAAKGAVPDRASCGLLRRRTSQSPSSSSSSLLLAPCCNVRRMGQRSFPAARTKARDEAEPEPQPQGLAPPKKEGEEAAPPAERSLAYQIFESVYLCAYVLSWRIGELIVVKAQDALERLRRYVLDRFNRKR